MGSYISHYVYQTPSVVTDQIVKLEGKQGCRFHFVDKIHVFEYLVPNATKLVIFSHGNGCDINSSCNYLIWLANHFGINVAVYDYPGYGLSTGKIGEQQCYRALDSVVSYYLKRFNHDQIVLMGHSLCIRTQMGKSNCSCCSI